MRVLGAILLGCALLLPATSSAAAMEKQQELLERAEDILYDLQEITEEEDALDGRVADNAETPTVEEEKENDEGLIMKKGCEDHQEGHEWGTSEHDNCYCQLEGPDLFRFCYHVDCLPGSEIVRDSKGLWDCPGGFSTADSSEKRANMSMLEDSLLQILEGEDYLDLGVADDEETPAVAEENALDLRGEADEGLIKKTGCEGHQLGEQWGSSDHNCICGGADRFCYPVVCLPGSQIKPDSKGLLRCEVDSSKRDITGSALGVTERENLKRAALGVFTEVVGLVGFALDREESAQTTQQLNEIQGQIRELDRKIDDLTRSVSDLQLGQQYLQQVILYARDEQRLTNALDTLARMRISNGQYAGSDIQGWADSVLSHYSDGINNVLLNLLNMVEPQSSVFGGKSLFQIYHQQLDKGGKGDLEQYSIKMRQKAGQVYGLIGGGYCAWIAALRIKGRQDKIPAMVREWKRKLSSVKERLQTYTVYGTCEDGYQLKYRKCYKAFDIRKTWTHASAYCKRQGVGGNLAMPKDRNINDFLIQLKNAKSSKWAFWFGLNDRQREGKWKWNDGTSLGSYNYWSPIEPNNGGKSFWGQYKNPEDCAEYFRKKWKKSNWNDAPCHLLRYFICERFPNSLLNVKKWRKDYRCGGRYTTAGGIRAECNPDGHAPCCSPHNWCGSTAAHCDCAGCVDYRNKGK
ncbi:PREDICTED: C-type lectin domain family 4 member M-like isoform X2 [Branchiostoma belcheri]|uniref:C-type lectin domain family 4 member M-like isoform X2 n=1 Tax=Branchiostoma belcheri TaxID=7741 RepID=A0A6P4ZVR4_BRABE|nr:PREDICTED: C-type lectin domain family 4 member M-like isoform X2 [Branchiostoma belcheri]